MTIEIPVYILLYIGLGVLVGGSIFLLGYFFGRVHNPALHFDGDLEERALEVAKAKIANKVIKALSEEEDNNVMEMKR